MTVGENQDQFKQHLLGLETAWKEDIKNMEEYEKTHQNEVERVKFDIEASRAVLNAIQCSLQVVQRLHG